MMRPRARILALLAVLGVPAWMLAVLQADVTNLNTYSASLVRDYAAGTIGDHWADGVPPIIWKARVLVRGLILALTGLTGGSLSVPTANLLIQAVFVAAALFVIYRATDALAPGGWGLFASALAVAFVPWGFLSVGYGISYPYDLPALFFSAAGLAAIAARRFDLLIAVVVFGTLNKETTIFLLPAYVLAEWPKAPRRQLLTRGVMLALAFGITYEVPRVLLQSASPMLVTVYGSVSEGSDSRVQSNLNHVFSGVPGGLIQSLWWVLMLHLPALLFFRRLPWVLKAAYLATPVFLVPLFFFGNVYEFRLYNELIPLGAMACAVVFAALLPAAPKAAKR